MSRPSIYLNAVPYESAFYWRNDPRIYLWCRQHTTRSFNQHKEYWGNIEANPHFQFYGIYLSKTKGHAVPIGVCGFTEIDWIAKSAEFSLYIAPDYHRKGYANQAILDLFSRGFHELGLNRIWGETFANNPAYFLFEKIGMKLEGTLRDAYFKDGKHIDAFVMSILKEEWDAKHSTAYMRHVLHNPAYEPLSYDEDSKGVRTD